MNIAEVTAAQDAIAAREADRTNDRGSASLGGAGSLGQEDFLAMLIAQLENQDPLDPQDATEFTAQLATFSSLDQLVGMRTALDRVAEITASSERLSTANLVGKRVTAESNQLRIGEGGSTRPTLAVDLDRPVETMVVELVDSFGRVRASKEFEAPEQGRHEVSWEDLDNPELTPGDYDIRISAGLDGLEATTPLVSDTITAASFETSQPEVFLGGIRLPFDRVREIGEQ